VEVLPHPGETTTHSAALNQVIPPIPPNYPGEVSATIEEMNYLEFVLGTKSRPGEQFDIWEAVYPPAGSDGYPLRIFNKSTGEIDHGVANYCSRPL
jgi:hypothetical protein